MNNTALTESQNASVSRVLNTVYHRNNCNGDTCWICKFAAGKVRSYLASNAFCAYLDSDAGREAP